MATSLGIPTTRASDAFVTQRLMSQIQSDQLELFKVQNQISTGRRVNLPSDDAPAAQRAILLQSLLERKQQVQSNLATSDSYLGATDTAIGGASELLTQVRGLAVSAIGVTTSDQQRAGIAEQIQQALEQLVNLGNQEFRGRYLLAGSKTTTPPYAFTDVGVAYAGDQKTLYSYADLNLLFQSNVTGDAVLGGVSEAIRGSVNLAPVLTESTSLADLYFGSGITAGSIRVSDGIQPPVTIDLASAKTVGDVARLIEANSPAGRTVTARVTPQGLTLQLDTSGGGTLTVTEVGSGRTARELGVFNATGVGTSQLVGGDLKPRLALTTRLADILGTRARAYVPFGGQNNDLVVEAATNGGGLNGVKVNFIDHDVLQAGAGLSAGNEFASYSSVATPAVASLRLDGAANDLILTSNVAGAAFNGVSVDVVNGGNLGDAANVTYNSTTKKLTIAVDDSDQTSVDALITAINASGVFTASRDASAETNTSGGVVLTANSATNVANTYNTGGDAKTLFVYIDPGQTTANQAAAAINATTQFKASLDRSEDLNTGDGAINDTWTESTATATTAGGSGIVFDQNSGIQIVNGGKTHVLSFADATTIEDVLNTINGAEAGVLAKINEAGTGVDIQTLVSGVDFVVGENGGDTASQLGIRSFRADTSLSQLNYGQGVRTHAEGDFRVRASDGSEFTVNLSKGVPASVRVGDASSNSGLVISRVEAGANGNNFRVAIVDSGAGGGDQVSLVDNTLTFRVDLASGFSAQEAVSLVAGNESVRSQITLRLDQSQGVANDGSGHLAALAPKQFSGGVSKAQSVGDVLDIINNQPSNLAAKNPILARLAQFGNGIELVQDGPPGTNSLRIERLNFSDAATDLGLLAEGENLSGALSAGATAMVSLVLPGADNDLLFSAKGNGAALNGVTIRFQDTGLGAGNETVAFDASNRTLTFDIDQASTTANRIVTLLATDPVAGQLFKAELVQPSTGAGLVGDLTATASMAGGAAQRLTGKDTNPIEVRSAFTALQRMVSALRNNDQAGMTRALALLDESGDRVTFSRAELGARMQGLDTLKQRLTDEETEVRGTLSKEIDVDLAEAISNMTARLAALQASLQISGQIAQLSLLNYL